MAFINKYYYLTNAICWREQCNLLINIRLLKCFELTDNPSTNIIAIKFSKASLSSLNLIKYEIIVAE